MGIKENNEMFSLSEGDYYKVKLEIEHFKPLLVSGVKIYKYEIGYN